MHNEKGDACVALFKLSRPNRGRLPESGADGKAKLSLRSALFVDPYLWTHLLKETV